MFCERTVGAFPQRVPAFFLFFGALSLCLTVVALLEGLVTLGSTMRANNDPWKEVTFVGLKGPFVGLGRSALHFGVD